MSQVQKFQFGLMDLRVVDRDGQPWFVANDVMYALGVPLNSHGKAIHSLAPDQRTLIQIQKGVRSPNIVSESGLYTLVMRSDRPAARAF
ncbi:BRO-N domain-containing protein [Pseudomonas tohonis]|uniref:BRO-N domain-containing protein n=1 Tax=Pseudomonas tohonis TaxID=2725477 RepID=UPI00255BEBE7|nr:Bro-N domain-containing protein [Pseudomonas tohonis]